MINWPIQPQNKKYAKWYELLIENSKKRIFNENEYFENHHIIPKSFGGTNDHLNLVKLSAREHYIAHALLWKMKFPGLYHSKMAYAFSTFIHGFKGKEHKTYKFSSRMYESFKKDFSLQVSLYQSGENNPYYGKKHSELTKKIIGEKSKQKIFKTGPDNPNWGKKLNISNEGKIARREAIKALWSDPIRRKALLEKRKQFLDSPEGIKQRKAHGDRLRGTKRDPAIVEKSASKRRGKKAEELFSAQALANIAEGRKHRVYKEETAKARDEMIREIGKRPKSEEHKRKISESGKGKHNHFGKNNPMFGKKHSLETIEKIRQTKLKNKQLKLDNNSK